MLFSSITEKVFFKQNYDFFFIDILYFNYSTINPHPTQKDRNRLHIFINADVIQCLSDQLIGV